MKKTPKKIVHTDLGKEIFISIFPALDPDGQNFFCLCCFNPQIINGISSMLFRIRKMSLDSSLKCFPNTRFGFVICGELLVLPKP